MKSPLRVVGVSGAGNSGKSHVLRWVIELMKARAVGKSAPTSISMQPYDTREVIVYRKNGLQSALAATRLVSSKIMLLIWYNITTNLRGLKR